MLRGVSSTLKERADGCGGEFTTKFTTDRLIKFADDVNTVLGKKNYTI